MDIPTDRSDRDLSGGRMSGVVRLHDDHRRDRRMDAEISPDEDRIAYLRAGAIWVKRLGAGAAEQILQVTAVRGLDW